MTIYVYTYRRDAYEDVLVEADSYEKADKIAYEKKEEIDWDGASYYVEYNDSREATAQEAECFETDKARSQLRGFNL
jgi:hypothetical protein